MFEVEPILWLQGFESPIVSGLMAAVSSLGRTGVYVGLVVVLAFGVRLRPALGVLLALLLAAILTDLLKMGLALPRPTDIDERVLEPAAEHRIPAVPRGASDRFWGLPTPAARAAVRALPDADYGFSSGHTAAAGTFALGLAIFFRWRVLAILALGWTSIMGLSRMYLGRHFLGDVLGGLVVAAIAALAAALLLRSRRSSSGPEDAPWTLAPLGALAVTLAIAAPFTRILDAENVGRLLGLATAYGLLRVRGLPPDAGSWTRRLGRVLVGGLTYVVLAGSLGVLFAATGWSETRLGELVAGAMITAGTLCGGVVVARKLGWYTPATGSSVPAAAVHTG